MMARTGLRRRLRGFWGAVSPRERLLLATAMIVCTALVFAYVLGIDHELAGDEPGYDADASLFAAGSPFWSVQPFGEAHPSAWKAPGYPAFLGIGYALLGDSPTRIELLQGLLLAPLTVLLAWLLARRLFGARVAIATAFGVALFPLAWEYFGLLFPEALAVPMVLLALLLIIDREPTPSLAVATGFVIGLNLLVRPSSFFLIATVLAAWAVAAGLRRGVTMTAVVVAVAALTVAPWTVRNAVVLDGFVPISMQDIAVYGTFNDEAAAADWAWRAFLDNPPEVLKRPDLAQIPEPELRSELQEFAFDYISDHPTSVAKAALWNGILRVWDLRKPADAISEADLQGRSRTVRGIGLAIYYLLLPMSLVGLWLCRRRREIIWPALATVAGIAIAFMVIGGTRYRAPLEPGVTMLAMLAAVSLLGRRGTSASTASPGKG